MEPMVEQGQLLPMSVGEQLRAARHARKLSLAAAARALKCEPQRLVDIENDTPGDLAPVYQRGFMLAYARWLGFNPQQLDALLGAAPPADVPLQAVGLQGRSLYAADRWLRAASYVLATLLVGTLAWQMTHEAVRLAQSDSVPAPATPVPAISSGAHVAASIGALEALRPATGSRTGAAGAGAWAALERVGNAQAEALQPGEHWLEVRASADSWVEITGRDDARVEQDLLRGGDVRRYRAFAPFRISLGRASAVELLVDGIAVDLEPHTRDNVTQMRLDPSAEVAAGS